MLKVIFASSILMFAVGCTPKEECNCDDNSSTTTVTPASTTTVVLPTSTITTANPPTSTTTVPPTPTTTADVGDGVEVQGLLGSPTPPEPPPPASTAAPVVEEPYYANCDAVRAAGAAPIHPGDPGWRQAFDRDKDGVGCE